MATRQPIKFQKKEPGLFQKILYSLANIALFKSIRSSLGLSNARICHSSGAVLSPDAFRFYHALNLPLKTVYGTTEGGPLAGATNDDISLEAVGPVRKGAEASVTAIVGLTVIASLVFFGYCKDPARTAEILKDGWFYSGDSAIIRENGHVLFLDRVRDLVRLASGDKLAPQFIEARLRFSPYIKDAWVMAGPQKAYVSAIIIINYDTVRQVGWAEESSLYYLRRTFAEAGGP